MAPVKSLTGETLWKGTLEELAGEMEEEPSEEESPRTTSVKPTSSGAQRQEVIMPDNAPLLLEHSSGTLEYGLARLCGLLPWSPRGTWSTWLYQQLTVLVVVTVAVAFSWRAVAENMEEQDTPEAIVEALLAVGSLLGLWACGVHWSSKRMVTALSVLNDWMSSNPLPSARGRIPRRDILFSLTMWIAAVALHIGIEVQDDPSIRTYQVVGFTVASLMHTALVSWIIYKCNCIMVILRTFSEAVTVSKDFAAAISEWERVRTCCQSVCDAVQVCVVILVTFGTGGVLVLVFNLKHEGVFLRMAPGLLLALVSFRILFYAAAVTDKCNRMPVLVNSINMGRSLDPTRMYAVQYIRYCQSGFYIFGVRIGCTGIFKVAYIGCAVAFAFLSNQHVDSPFIF